MATVTNNNAGGAPMDHCPTCNADIQPQAQQMNMKAQKRIKKRSQPPQFSTQQGSGGYFQSGY